MGENSWEESLFYRQLWAIFAGETCKWGIIAGGNNQVLWMYDVMLCRLPSCNHACPPLWCDLSYAMDCSSFSMHLLCYQHMLLAAQLLTCHDVTSTSAMQGTYHVELWTTTVFSTWHALVSIRILHLVLHHAYNIKNRNKRYKKLCTSIFVYVHAKYEWELREICVKPVVHVYKSQKIL